jgi:hypothetical protein
VQGDGSIHFHFRLQASIESLTLENDDLKMALKLEEIRSGKMKLIFKLRVTVEEIERAGEDGIVSESIEIGDITL